MRHVSLHGLLAPFAACLLLMCGAAEAHAQPPVAVFVREAPTMGAQGMSFRVDLHPMAAANGSDVHVEVVFAHAPAAPMPAPGRTAAVEAGALPAALPPAAAMEVLPAGAGDPGGARLRVLARHDAAAAPPADAARAAGGEAAVAFFVVASACAAPAPPAAPAAAAEAGLRCGGPTSSTPRGGGPQPEVQHATPEQALPAPPEARVLLTRQEAGAGTWSMRADHPLRLVGPLSLAFQLPPETLLQGQEASGPILLRLSGPAFEAPLVVPLQTVGGADAAWTADPSGGTALPWILSAAAGAVLGLGGWWMRHRADDEGWLLGFAALFTRLRRPALLDQPTRRRIHELVEADPGILFSHLRKRLALPAGVATHHLQVLEAHGLVASVRAGSRRHLYPAGRAPSGAPLPAHAQRILSLLGSGARPQQEIARALPLTPQGVSYHLQTLLAAGRLVRERDGSGRWVYHARGAADAS